MTIYLSGISETGSSIAESSARTQTPSIDKSTALHAGIDKVAILPRWIQFLRLCKDLHNRKNWLRVGSERAGPVVAAILSVVETCRRHQIPIRQYLASVLPGLGEFPANRASELTPASWARSRS
jgi:hypothetical protein